eukprot:scaffold5956_cov155-Skeletonema_menzelii.AAC.3
MLLTAAIIAAAAYAKNNDGEDGSAASDSRANPQNMDALFLQNKASIDLLPLEQTLLMMEHPINTISFYSISPSCDVEEVVKKLEGRVHEILKANPWLGGWYVKGFKNGSFDNTPRIWYDTFGDEMAPNLFQALSDEDVPINSTTPFLDYENILCNSTALVKTNPNIVNRKEESMFRVTAIVSKDKKEIALISSMSHICGDGHTYYQIHNMVLGEPIIAMIPERELRYSEKVMTLMGRQEAHYISHITTDPVWAKLLRMTSEVEEDPGSELHMRTFVVNQHWVGNIKATHMSEGTITDITKSTMRSPMASAFNFQIENSQNPTQSTNDIIVSWFWSLVKPNVGLMAVNMRGRVDIVSENNAGNYHNPIPYVDREDYKSPLMIRESLATCRRAGRVPGSNTRTELPPPSPDLTFSIISNWASFRPPAFREQDEKGSNLQWNSQGVCLIRHLPIMFPERLTKTMPKRMSFLVIFSCGNDDVGCILMAPGRVIDEIDTCGIVHEMIAKF